MARRWRVGRRGCPLHLRLHNVNEPLAARCCFAAEGRSSVRTARQVGTASRRAHVPDSAWIHRLGRAVYSAELATPRHSLGHVEQELLVVGLHFRKQLSQLGEVIGQFTFAAPLLAVFRKFEIANRR